MDKKVKDFEPQYFGEWENKGFERALNIIRKFLLILAGIVVISIIAFNVSDDIWYEAHVQAVRIFGKEDGIICLTPYTCVEVIHDYNTLYNLQMEYIENYGAYAPNRPIELYRYNTDMHAYVRWYFN